MRARAISLTVLALTSLTFARLAEAQTPATVTPGATQAAQTAKPHDVTKIDHASSTPNYHYSFYPPIPVEPSHPNYYAPAHKTVVRHNPLPQSDHSWGVRNPGGVGRYAEYYPPDNKFQNANARVPVAKFDTGEGPNRAEQQASQSLGIQRANQIQGNINSYSRMSYGYGFGLGGGGGGVYGFPN